MIRSSVVGVSLIGKTDDAQIDDVQCDAENIEK